MVGAPVQWLWEETHVLKFVGSNPSTVYWIDIFPQIFVANIVMFLKIRNRWKRGRGWPILKRASWYFPCDESVLTIEFNVSLHLKLLHDFGRNGDDVPGKAIDQYFTELELKDQKVLHIFKCLQTLHCSIKASKWRSMLKSCLNKLIRVPNKNLMAK